MPEIAKLIGSAGTGKTTELLGIMEKVVDRLHDPHLVGFCSFTKAACDEAADRAADLFGLPRRELRDAGWFKTIHGIAYRCIGVTNKLLLTDNRESQQWIEDTLQEKLPTGMRDDDLLEENDSYIGDYNTSMALHLWNAARNRLEPLQKVWDESANCNDRTPDYDYCKTIIERYEQGKRLDHRIDFVDLLGLFAGFTFQTEGPSKCDPTGEPPQQIEAWIHDEMQDSSPLLDACFQRLIHTDACKWVYLAGDPFQAIYRWSGSDHHCFLDGYPAAKQRIMPKSYRCPENILQLGENILSQCSDYFNRGVAPSGPGGDIDEAYLHGDWIDEVDPRQSWLILARTNSLAIQLAKLLNERGIVWHPTKKDSGSKWRAPRRFAAVSSMMSLDSGAWIDGAEWRNVVTADKFLPVKLDGEALLVHGFKAQITAMSDAAAADRWPWLQLSDLTAAGATPKLVELIRTKQWINIANTGDWMEAISRWGWEAVQNPGVRLGTVHSAKGAEADNVVLLTTVTMPCVRGAESQEGFNEEQRCKYVAVTRARRRLILVKQLKARARWKV